MPTQRYERYLRLQSKSITDLERGFRSEVADPVWFLGKQWLMGEHQGENASTPVKVEYEVSEHRITYPAAPKTRNPQIVPPEAIVEEEAYNWWTIGRRVRIGLQIAQLLKLDPQEESDPSLLLHNPPPPYERFDQQYDGLQLWVQRSDPRWQSLGLRDSSFPADVPRTETAGNWDPAELVYTATFQAGDTTLSLPRHMGGDIDWYSVNADHEVDPDMGKRRAAAVYPTQFSYPGAPVSRWWEIEDARVDIGGMPPDPSHFPTTLLVDLIVSHGDDWFIFPIDTHIGTVLTITAARVKDSFGDWYDLQAAADDWAMFRTRNLDKLSLVLWPTVMTPLSGEIVEEVLFGTDEYSNVLWAVERRANGREILSPAASERTADHSTGLDVENGSGETIEPTYDASAPKSYRYVPGQNVLPHWHPYVIEDTADPGDLRRLIQGHLVDISGVSPQLMPEPQAEVLYDLRAQYIAEGGRLSEVTTPPHSISPSTIPVHGMRIQRRWMLTRDVRGQPVLWVQRHRRLLMAPPARQLRFDVFRERITST